MKIKGCIKPGATLMHDHGFFAWPDCADGLMDPTLEFDCTLHHREKPEACYWECKREGFGIIGGNYGNGSLLVNGLDSVVPA